ncbi:hypothetical protein D3C72_839180 [compost metagenome]
MESSGGPSDSTLLVTKACSLSRWAGVLTFSSFSISSQMARSGRWAPCLRPRIFLDEPKASTLRPLAVTITPARHTRPWPHASGKSLAMRWLASSSALMASSISAACSKASITMMAYHLAPITRHQVTKLMLILVDLASPRGAAMASRWPVDALTISGRRL